MSFQIKVSKPDEFSVRTHPSDLQTHGQAEAAFRKLRAVFPVEAGYEVRAYRLVQVEEVVEDITDRLNAPEISPVEKGVI